MPPSPSYYIAIFGEYENVQVFTYASPRCLIVGAPPCHIFVYIIHT